MKLLLLAFVLMVSGVDIPAAERSLITATRADLFGGLKSALDQFAVDCGRYPTTSEGLEALMTCPTNLSTAHWHGPYLDKLRQDIWKHDYGYHCPGIHNTNGFDLYSCGFDGISKSGGEDLDDINNWDPNSPHGRNDEYLNYVQMVTHSPEFFLSIFAFWIIITVVGVLRLIAAIFSQSVRTSITRHPTAHIIWLLLSLVAPLIFFILGIPRIAG